MDYPERKDMSYNEYVSKYFGAGCLYPYSLYKTKRFLFFKKRVFLKFMPCGHCLVCRKNLQDLRSF